MLRGNREHRRWRVSTESTPPTSGGPRAGAKTDLDGRVQEVARAGGYQIENPRAMVRAKGAHDRAGVPEGLSRHQFRQARRLKRSCAGAAQRTVENRLATRARLSNRHPVEQKKAGVMLLRCDRRARFTDRNRAPSAASSAWHPRGGSAIPEPRHIDLDRRVFPLPRPGGRASRARERGAAA